MRPGRALLVTIVALAVQTGCGDEPTADDPGATRRAAEPGIPSVRTFLGAGLAESARLPPVATGTWAEFDPSSRTDNTLKTRVAAAIGAGRLRQSVVLAVMDTRRVLTAVHDPANTLSGELREVASRSGYRTPGVAGEDLGGTAGICYPDGATPQRDAAANTLYPTRPSLLVAHVRVKHGPPVQ